MTWDKGFNFRSTSGFVTDGTNETYMLNELYPVTRNDVTFGLVSGSVGTLNGDVSYDRRIAGANWKNLGDGSFDFQVDLPASGDYLIRLASGKQNEAPGNQSHSLRDNTTVLWTVTGNPQEDEFIDANGVIYSAANWPSSNTARLATFATTTLILRCTTSDYRATIAHLFVSQVVEGGGSLSEDYGSFPMHVPGARRIVTVFS